MVFFLVSVVLSPTLSFFFTRQSGKGYDVNVLVLVMMTLNTEGVFFFNTKQSLIDGVLCVCSLLSRWKLKRDFNQNFPSFSI